MELNMRRSVSARRAPCAPPGRRYRARARTRAMQERECGFGGSLPQRGQQAAGGGDVVGVVLALGDLEGALCLDSRLGLLAVIRESLRQAQAGAEVLRVDRQRASDEALALRGVTAERPRDVQQQRALAEERGRELRREGERAIHRLPDRS